MNICTGGILIKDKFNVDDDFILQLDVILYEPNPLPPIFQVYDFGLVPKESVFGVLEIKRTDYSSGLKHIEDLYDWKFNNLPSYGDKNGSLHNADFMGVVCLVERYKLNSTNKLTQLDKENKLCYLIYKEGDDYKINHKGIFKLLNFIVKARNINKIVGTERKVDMFNVKTLF